jgi:peptidoglycan/LPS O-acetylase OafA/YrhL
MDGPVWSLVVEVQFYILLPLFAWLVARLARGRLALAVALVTAVGGGLLALRVATVTTAGTVDPVWRYSLPATAVFFVPGLLLALGHVAIDRRPRAWTRRAWVGDSSMWLLAGAALWLVVAHRYTWDALLLPASALLVGACALPLRPGALVRVLDVRMVAAVGAASYSLYLWHEPVVHALANAGWVPAGFVPLLVASVLLCVAVAVSSYAVVEAPFLRLRRSWSAARAARLDVDGGGALGRSWQTALHSFVVRSRWIPLPTRPPQ